MNIYKITFREDEYNLLVQLVSMGEGEGVGDENQQLLKETINKINFAIACPETSENLIPLPMWNTERTSE